MSAPKLLCFLYGWQKIFTNKNIFSKHYLHVLFILFFCKMYNKEKLFSIVQSPQSIHRQKNKSTDLMNIPVFIYNILASLIAPTVSILFNNLLSEGIFPEFFNPTYLSIFCMLLPRAGVKHPTGERWIFLCICCR